MITYTLTLLVVILAPVLLYGGLSGERKSTGNTRQPNTSYKKNSQITISEKERELH